MYFGRNVFQKVCKKFPALTKLVTSRLFSGFLSLYSEIIVYFQLKPTTFKFMCQAFYWSFPYLHAQQQFNDNPQNPFRGEFLLNRNNELEEEKKQKEILKLFIWIKLKKSPSKYASNIILSNFKSHYQYQNATFNFLCRYFMAPVTLTSQKR